MGGFGYIETSRSKISVDMSEISEEKNKESKEERIWFTIECK